MTHGDGRANEVSFRKVSVRREKKKRVDTSILQSKFFRLYIRCYSCGMNYKLRINRNTQRDWSTEKGRQNKSG